MTPIQPKPRTMPRFIEALTQPDMLCGIPALVRLVDRAFARYERRPPRAESLELTVEAKSA